MSEIITDSLMLELLARAYLAFPSHVGMKNNPAGTVAIYRESMHGLTGEALRAGVRIAIEQGKYFPKIFELRDAAWEWTRRNRAELEPHYGDPLYCQRCNSLARWRDRWRPAVDADGYVIHSDDGAYVRLERFERLLCACATACLYSPEPDFDEPWMAANRIKWAHGRQRAHRPARRPIEATGSLLADVIESTVERMALGDYSTPDNGRRRLARV